MKKAAYTVEGEESFTKHVLVLGKRIQGDEFIYFEEKLKTLLDCGWEPYIGYKSSSEQQILSTLLPVWSNIYTTEDNELYKAWYIDTRRVIDGQPLILYSTTDYLEELSGIGNYRLKIILYRLHLHYKKYIPSIEIRFTDDSNDIKKVIAYNGLPAIHCPTENNTLS